MVKSACSSSMTTAISGTNRIASASILCLNERTSHGKEHRCENDPSSHPFASHETPEHQAVYTSTDSTVISPSVRHTNIEPMSDQRETHIPSTLYQPVVTSSRPPSTGPMTGRPYPYSSTSDTSLCRTLHRGSIRFQMVTFRRHVIRTIAPRRRQVSPLR